MHDMGPRTAVTAVPGPVRPPPTTAHVPVVAAAVAVTTLLLLTAGGYGYHRDELYFRVLEPAWGYVDQPPLMPFLVRTLSGVVDAPWAVRIPSALAAGVSVVLAAHLTRELGGGRSAQAWSGWMLASAPATLVLGHLGATAAIDLAVWLGIALCAVRALLRPAPAWWLAAGAVAGLGTWNKWLLAGLLVSGLAGLLAVGPRRELRSPWLVGGVVVAVVIAAPNLAHQATHGWPQLAMGAALRADHAAEVRPLVVPFLGVLLGPPLVPVWVAGWWALWRRPAWRPVRFVAVAFPVLVVLTVLGGAQLYYPTGLLAVLLAAGCVPLAELMARTRERWRPHVAGTVAVNGVVAAVVALPLLPVDALVRTPVPALNPGVGDQLGWPRYAAQVGTVVGTVVGTPEGDDERAGLVVVASTYGLAGALDRFGPQHGVDDVVSGHNHLGTAGPPEGEPAVVVVVGDRLGAVAHHFASCHVVARLDNGLGVATEEQGDPVAVCRDPLTGWDAVWSDLRYLG
ncbi:glycosyltransferase family 39 protein [Actinotalea sp. AC32]|nr:glycosyltransferase family 39 protein [Actinotalea sp. AC32]